MREMRGATWIHGVALATAGILLASCSGTGTKERERKYIPPAKVWSKVKKESAKHGLDPHFVYAICHAESSLNAHAETSVARGMMQLTEAGCYPRQRQGGVRFSVRLGGQRRDRGSLPGQIERHAHEGEEVHLPKIGCELSLGILSLEESWLRREQITYSEEQDLSQDFFRQYQTGDRSGKIGEVS